MTMLALILLGLGLLIELFFAWCLLDWRGRLRRFQYRIDLERQGCYACITGASASSFAHLSTMKFCNTHKAHWHLVHDLEEEMFQ